MTKELTKIVDELEGQLIETLGDLDPRGPFMAEEMAILRSDVQRLYLTCRGIRETHALTAYDAEAQQFYTRMKTEAGLLE